MSKRKAPGSADSEAKGTEKKPKSINMQIADFLFELANYEKNVSQNSYKYSAYRKAASVVASTPEPITSGAQAKKLNGVGDKIAKKIDEFLTTGKLEKLDKIRADSTSSALNELSRVAGIGPVKARELFEEGITSVEELKKHQDKLTKAQKIGLKHFEDFEKRIPRAEIVKIEKLLNEELEYLDNKYIATICGSYRRGLPTSGDIDVLLTHDDLKSKNKNEGKMLLENVVKRLEKTGLVTDIISLGDSKFMGVCQLPKELATDEERPFRRIDIMILPKEMYYCGVLYFTGSDMFNKAMRTRALEMKFTLNEYTLRPLDQGNQPLAPLPVSCEEDIFDYISFPYKEPKDRNM